MPLSCLAVVVSTFIVRTDPLPGADGPTVAIKDLIDVAGVPTTYGSPAFVAAGPGSLPAAADAACLAGFRAAGARIVGKTNLHELAFGGRGVNPHFGTPRNPLDPTRIPGGSSSGSAVAVADGDATLALGSDTGGSVRIPAACCGVVGLKTTHGRISLDGCQPLATSFDTIGPLGVDVAAVAQGMALLDPEFRVAPASELPLVVGRPLGAPAADPVLEAAVTSALRAAGLEVVDVDLRGWEEVNDLASASSARQAFDAWHWLLDAHGDLLGADVAERLRAGGEVSAETSARADSRLRRWREELAVAFDRTTLLVTPTLTILPPRLDEDVPAVALTGLTRAANAGGNPAISLPVPLVGVSGPLVASLQLMAPWGREDLLVAMAARIEAAVGPGPFGRRAA